MKQLTLMYKLISSLLLFIILSLVVLLIGVKVIGYTPYAVLSGSMEPLYPTGSIVYVKDVDIEEIEIGDAITFYMSDQAVIVTHEVIDIDEENQLYYTKGLANDSADANPVSSSNIIGTVYFCIPYLGYVSTYITSPPWIYIIIIGTLIWGIVVYMIDLLIQDKKRKQVNSIEE